MPPSRPILICCLGICVTLATGFARGAPNPERWRWSNPLPHGNNIFDMVVSADRSVQVGDAGTIYVQGLDDRWAPALTGTTNYLRGVALFGTRILAVGENGTILWSDNGTGFQPATLSPAVTSDWFEAVATSDQRAVAVGDNGTIYTTTNGTAWTKVTSGTTEWLRGVAFGGSYFVAVGESGSIFRSGTSANSWSKQTSPTTVDLNRVRYLGNGAAGRFYALGNNGVAITSTNGAAPWSSLNPGTTNYLCDAALNDTGLLLVGDQEILFRQTGTSTWTNQVTGLTTNAPPAWTYLSAWGSSNIWVAAGRTGLMVEGTRTNGSPAYAWRALPSSSHAWLWDLTVQRGIAVAVGDLATILTSLDGILWASEVVPADRTNVVLLGVGGTTNLLAAVGNNGSVLLSRVGLTNITITNTVGTNIIVTNTTFDTFGTIWNWVPPFTTNSLQGVAAGLDLVVLTGDRGLIFTSTDGSNFVTCVTPTTNFLSSVAAGPDSWVAVGNRGSIVRASALATNWAAIGSGTTNWLYKVRYLGGSFVAVGQNGTLFTSPDGLAWTPRISGTTRWLTDVTFLNGWYYVAGTQGLLLGSSNLVNWTALPLPTIKSLYAAAQMGGRLLLAGVEGAVLRNPTIPDLTPVDCLAYQRSVVPTTLTQQGTNFTYQTAYELFLFGGQPDQYFQFQSTTNLPTAWKTNATFELFDPSGTIYLIRSRDLTNTPPREFYRTALAP